MTGLDRILSQISFEARSAAEATLANAGKQASAIMLGAEEEAKAEQARIAQQSNAAVKDALERAQSAAALQKKKAVLSAKQQIIQEVIGRAKQSLYALSAPEYFAVIVKMAARHALPQAGEILFSPADSKRLPAGFEQTLAAAISEKGGTLTVSKQTRPIDGGFVLAYGGIEENCSFDALFNAAHETLLDKVHGLLFS